MNKPDHGRDEPGRPDAGAPDAASHAPDGAAHEPDGATNGSDANVPTTPTHSGLISIQDIAIANFPQAGHGLSVQAFFTALRRPDFEEKPGAPDGCKAWAYDVTQETPPPLEDHGTITLSGIEGGTVSCAFQAGRGYVCPTAGAEAALEVHAADGATARYDVQGAAFTSADVGRYLNVSGAPTPPNNGAFAIVQVLNASSVLVTNALASAEMFSGAYGVLAGAGPTPMGLYNPFPTDTQVEVALKASGVRGFADAEVHLTPPEALQLDDATAAALVDFPVAATPLELRCAGEGGVCSAAPATIVRITTTDANLEGLGPTAMPPAERRFVEISCATLGDASVTIPSEALALIEQANAESPITRIRAAFMRDDVALVDNSPPEPPNRLVIAVGRGVLGFTNFAPEAHQD